MITHRSGSLVCATTDRMVVSIILSSFLAAVMSTYLISFPFLSLKRFQSDRHRRRHPVSIRTVRLGLAEFPRIHSHRIVHGKDVKDSPHQGNALKRRLCKIVRNNRKQEPHSQSREFKTFGKIQAYLPEGTEEDAYQNN